MQTKFIDADLLIIGGGSAGCMAAIRALQLQPDLKVVIFEKGDIKYSGSIARGMDALNIVAIPNFTSPELYLEAILTSCQGVADAKPSYLMAQRSYELLKKLESWGVYFPLDENGKYRTLRYHVKGEFQTAMEEPDLKIIISRKSAELGAQAVNRVMGLELLLDDGRVAGAVGLHTRTGHLIACKAKAVIVSAGGQARFNLPSSGYLYGLFDYPGNSGDGYVMAYKAGAGLTGMESATRAMLIKDASMPLLAITVTRGGRVLDAFDNILMENEVHTLSRMEEAFVEGKGPLRIQLSHLPPVVIDEIEHILFSTERPVQERFFKGRGINFRNRDIELWPTEYQICGGHGHSGVYVDEKAQTGVPGLYAAGDVACVPKQHLSGAFVFGEVAAEEAIEFMRENNSPKLNEGQVRAAEQLRDRRFSSTGRDIRVMDFEYKVRRMIGDYLTGIKNEHKLSRWFEWSGIFKTELENHVIAGNGHELSKLYEAEHIIRCADFAALASLERKESRWGPSHQRSDYPQQDDANWLKHVILKSGDGQQGINIETSPILGMDA